MGFYQCNFEFNSILQVLARGTLKDSGKINQLSKAEVLCDLSHVMIR